MSPNPALFGGASAVLVVAAGVVATASDPRRALVAVATASVAVAALYAQLGAYEAMAAQAIFYGGGAIAIFLVMRTVRVAAKVALAPAVRPVRAAMASLLVMGVLAKVQLGDAASGASAGGAPMPPPSPTLVAPAAERAAAAAPSVYARYVLPGGLALVVLFAGLVGAPALPKPRRGAPEERA